MTTELHAEQAQVPSETFVEADLVVAEPHWQLVAAELKDLDVTVSGLVAARTVPGVKSARQALEELLSDPDSSVRPYVYPS
jgi:hypothetical protein